METAKAATTTSCMPFHPRRRANQTDKAKKSAVNASDSLASVGTTTSGGPSTRIAPPAEVSVSASLPTKPSAPTEVTPTRIFWPVTGKNVLGTKVSTAVVPLAPLPRTSGVEVLLMIVAGPITPLVQFCKVIDWMR